MSLTLEPQHPQSFLRRQGYAASPIERKSGPASLYLHFLPTLGIGVCSCLAPLLSTLHSLTSQSIMDLLKMLSDVQTGVLTLCKQRVTGIKLSLSAVLLSDYKEWSGCKKMRNRWPRNHHKATEPAQIQESHTVCGQRWLWCCPRYSVMPCSCAEILEASWTSIFCTYPSFVWRLVQCRVFLCWHFPLRMPSLKKVRWTKMKMWR